MEASVIIITKNQKSLLQKSLPLLLNQKLKGKYEIVVVDSGSTDGAREYLESLPIRLVKIKPENFNFASAFNAGAKRARGKYLIRLSGDVIPFKKNFLRELLKPFKDLKVGGTYGKYMITDRKAYQYPDFWPAERFPRKMARYSMYPNPIKMLINSKFREEIFNFAGGCCAIRREIWKKRPFNKKLIAGEDAEYAWFLHIIGYDIVYNPKAKVIHEHRVIQHGRQAFIGGVFSKFMWQLRWQMAKYYLQSLFLKDPYKNLRIN